MKKRTHILRYFLVLLLSVSIVDTQTKTTVDAQVQDPISAPTETATKQEISNAVIEANRKLILDLISALEFSVENIAMYVSEKDIVVENQEEFIENLKQMRKLMHTTARDIMMYADMSLLSRALKAVKLFHTHVQNVANNGFKTFPQFEVDAAQFRSVTDMTSDEIKDTVKTIKTEIDGIKKQTESAGISFGHKVYRNSLGWAIDSSEYYNAHGKVAKGIGISLILLYLYWRSGADSFGALEKHLDAEGKVSYAMLYNDEGIFSRSILTNDNYSYFKKARAILNRFILRVGGRPPYSTLDQNNIAEHTPYLTYNIFGRTEDFVQKLFSRNDYALGGLIVAGLSNWYENEVRVNIDWTKKRLWDAHCWLKGGIYKKQIKNRSDKPLSMNPRYRFDDIIGYQDAKRVGLEIIEFINDPEKFQRQGVTPPKGILLHGPPGTGKSLWAEALCGELKDALKRNNRSEKEFIFFNVKSTDIQQMGLDRVLNIMKLYAPCIVFIDEIDLLSLQRDRNPERLAEFLSGVSGFLAESDPKKQVIIIGATNKLENVDKAITRSGRLSKLVYLDYPSFESRYELLVRVLGDRINPDLFDLKKIARQTDECTMEDLRTIVNIALFRTRITGKPLTQKDLEDALNSEVRRIAIKQELDLPESEQFILAAHMAGHAVARMLLPTEKVFSTVTIKPVAELLKEKSVWSQYYQEKEPGQVFGKIFTHKPHDSISSTSTEMLKNECKVQLAGRIAEQVLLGTISMNNSKSCSGTCKPSALNIAKAIMLDGLEEDQLSKKMKEKLLDDAFVLLHQLEQEIKTFFEEQKQLLTLVTHLLVEYKTITQDEILGVLKMLDEMEKQNPELIEKLQKEMADQEQQKKEAVITNAIEDELGIQEQSVVAL